MRNFLAGLAACAVMLCAGYGLASRNSVGTMSAANGPYISGTSISSSAINSRFADIESEITDSLSRSGKGGMSAALKGPDGTVAAPAFSFTAEPGSGLYRIGATDYGFSVNGVKKHEWTSTGESVTGTLAVSGLHTQTLTGSASTIAHTIFEPSLTNANLLQFIIGRSSSGFDYGAMTYVPNATAALSTVCLGVNGGSASALCVDGNNKATTAGPLQIGAGGTSVGASKTVTFAWTPGPLTGPACVGLSQSVTNIAFGDTCILSPPSAFGLGAWSTSCFVSAAGSVLAQVCLLTGTATAPSGNYTIRTFQAAN